MRATEAGGRERDGTDAAGVGRDLQVTDLGRRFDVAPVTARDPDVAALLGALTAELATGGYSAGQTFGYSPEQLEQGGVALMGVRVPGRLVGVGGVEPQAHRLAELKRLYVVPDMRGSGAADALLTALLERARAGGGRLVRLETGDKQRAALAFYRRHGFVEVPRFGPYEDSATSVCLQRQLH